jgi:aspartyl-tRNA(Asn)/glutamyl-tRNA(Gln) amidotransferase subunit A
MSSGLQWLTVPEAATRIKDGRLTPTAYVGAILDWIESVEADLQNFVYLAADDAMAAAREAEQEIKDGHYRGPLHGIPFTTKDLVEVEHVPMTCGSNLLTDFTSTRTATVVQRLQAAGAIFLGKVVGHEFACGVTSPPARNPWNTAAVPGGSSGGSGSAVAAGQAPLSIGTDTGASIRNPAALNGAVGVRPTQGRVPQTGVVPLSMTFDTTGPLARSVGGAAHMLNVMAGYDADDPTTSTAPVPDFTTALDESVDGLTVGVPDNYFFTHIEPDVERAVRDAIDCLVDLGMDRVDVTLPDVDQTVPIWNTIVPPENAALFEDLMDERDEINDALEQHVMAGTHVLAKDYARGNQMRTVVQQNFAKAFSDVDVLVTPTTAATAKVPESRDEPIYINVEYPDGYSEDIAWAYTRYTLPISLAGIPATIVPCGFDSDDLPVGMQIVAPAFDEATSLQVAAAYERATDWSDRKPPITS